MSTRLGLGAIAALGIADQLRQRSLIRHQDGSVDARLSSNAMQFGSKTKVSLSNAEVLAVFGGGFCPATPIEAIVTLSGHQDPFPTLIRLEEPGQAAEAMREHILVPDPAYRSRWLARESEPDTRPAALAQLNDLVMRCQVVQLAWNLACHDTHKIVQWLSRTLTDNLELLSLPRLECYTRRAMYE